MRGWISPETTFLCLMGLLKLRDFFVQLTYPRLERIRPPFVTSNQVVETACSAVVQGLDRQ